MQEIKTEKKPKDHYSTQFSKFTKELEKKTPSIETLNRTSALVKSSKKEQETKSLLTQRPTYAETTIQKMLKVRK